MSKLMMAILVYLLLEIAVFIFVGQYLGVPATLLLVLATSAFGLFLSRKHGMQSMSQALEGMQRGHPVMPGSGIDLLLVFSGFLLFLPGFITDALGLCLCFGFIRNALYRRCLNSVMGRAYQQQAHNPNAAHEPRTIEGEFERKDD